MVTGKCLDPSVEKPLSLVYTPPPIPRHEVDDGSWTLFLPESHNFSAMSSFFPGEQKQNIDGSAKAQENQPGHSCNTQCNQFLSDSPWLKTTPESCPEQTGKHGMVGETEYFGQSSPGPPGSIHRKSHDLLSLLAGKIPSSNSPSCIGYVGEQGPHEESKKLTKEERALRRRAFHKIHTRRSRAKLNDKMEHLRQVLPSPPSGICVKSKAQILDWAIACASAQKLSSSQDICSICLKRKNDF